MAKKKHTFQFEVALSVAKYWEDDNETAFENCKQDFDAALEVAQEELTEAGVAEEIKDMKVKVDRFLEFDSGNPTHAGGYFLIEMSGSNKEDIATVERLHTEWVGGIRK